jgi:hypothetical protein
MTAPRASGAPQGAQGPGAASGGGSGSPEPAEGDTALRDQIAEALYRWTLKAAGGRAILPPHEEALRENSRARADAVLPVFAAMLRDAAQAIEDSRGENLDPLATAIASGCRVHDTAPAVFDDARNIAIVAYRHLADRIARPEGAP